MFSNTFTGQFVQIHEWTNYMSDTQFCFRACKDGPNAPALCQHIYDEMGCAWNMPANYDAGTFERCEGDSGEVCLMCAVGSCRMKLMRRRTADGRVRHVDVPPGRPQHALGALCTSILRVHERQHRRCCFALGLLGTHFGCDLGRCFRKWSRHVRLDELCAHGDRWLAR